MNSTNFDASLVHPSMSPNSSDRLNSVCLRDKVTLTSRPGSPRAGGRKISQHDDW